MPLKLMVFYLKNRPLLFVVICLSLFLSSCNSNNDSKNSTEEKELVLYQPSEMANLMNDFYAYNERLKKAIINGDTLEAMPDSFKAIHTAKMTDAKGRNTVFNSFAPAFIASQQRIMDTLSDADLKMRYNNTINLCISCHKTECVGPIPRIKKLLIQ